MDLLMNLIESAALVVGRIRLTLVVADRHPMIMGRREFTAQSDVVDASRWVTKVGGEIERQMVNAGELDDPSDRKRKLQKEERCYYLFVEIKFRSISYLVEYSISPVGLRCISNSWSGVAEQSSNVILGRFLKLGGQIKYYKPNTIKT